VYIVDRGDNSIKKFDSSGTLISKTPSIYELSGPIKIGPTGNINVVEIRTSTGNSSIEYLSTYSKQWGFISQRKIGFVSSSGPMDSVSIDTNGNLLATYGGYGEIVYVSASDNSAHRFFRSQGAVSSSFDYPVSAVFHPNGKIYIAEVNSNRIRIVNLIKN
jgi:hypothetical protein